MKASRLPSLAALKAFESVGRHLSFQRAADELCLTPSAISHQVRTLENQLGTRLFVRRHHELELTPIGKSYLTRVQVVINDLLDATTDVIDSNGQAPLTLQLCPSLAATWLIKKLGSFREKHPEIEINVVTPYEDPHFILPEVDIAILYGNGTWSGVRSEHLMGEKIVPVCSPDYLSKAPQLLNPSDLSEHTLIRCMVATNPEWSYWLDSAGVADLSPKQNLRMHNRVQCLEAATHGLGIAIGRRPCVDEAIKNGILVTPFDQTMAGFSAYYLVYPDQAIRLPRIAAFREWVMEQGEIADNLDFSHNTPAKVVAV